VRVPLAVAFAAALSCVLSPGVGRATPADSLANAAPPAAPLVRAAAPAPARADSTRRHPWHEQPRFVMARSLLVPGWGQLHNHAWWKAVLVAGVEGVLGTRIVQDQRALNRLLGDIGQARAQAGQALRDSDVVQYEAALARENTDVNEYNSRLDQRLARQWLLGGVLAYALVDAYVDANFRGFDVEFKHDPALPAGTSPAGTTGGGDGAGVRLALRWTF
jgi:hypothetical protein